MKTRTLVLFPLLILTMLILSACQVFPWFSVVRGSGTITSESHSVSGFTAVQLDGAGHLIITQGVAESLEIQADDNLIADLTSSVQGSTLFLGYQDQPWRRTVLPSRPVVYTLTVTDLTSLTLNGAGDLTIHALEAEDFNLEINGAGNVTIGSLSAGKFSVELAGAGSVSVSGSAVEQTVTIDGAGSYQAGDLQSYDAHIEINGLGSAVVWAADTLQVSINGAGSVDYYGSPQLTQEISGLGNVNKLGDK